LSWGKKEVTIKPILKSQKARFQNMDYFEKKYFKVLEIISILVKFSTLIGSF
jgi:hypothetical protein